MTEFPTCAQFETAIGDEFRVFAEGMSAPLPLTLTEARDAAKDGADMEFYSLIFSGPREPLLTQQIYRISHDGLGEHDLFMTSLGPGESGMMYQIIINFTPKSLVKETAK